MTKIIVSAIIALFFSSFAQFVFGQQKTPAKQKKLLICSDCEPVNGKALYLPTPEYPKAASLVSASGAVQVQILIDENGNVIEANPVSGHPFLWQASVKSALQAKFKPTFINGKSLRVSAVIVYNYISALPNQVKKSEERRTFEPTKREPGSLSIGNAVKLPRPAAISCNCGFGKKDTVIVEAAVDERGNVTGATAISGHPILKSASVAAAHQAKFSPSLMSNVPLRTKATIVYTFTSPGKWTAKLKDVFVKNIQPEN